MNNPLNVAIALSGLGSINRGAESWARDLAYSLHNRGIKVTLIKGSGRKNSSIERVVPCIKRNSLLLKRTLKSYTRRVVVEQTSFAAFLIPYSSLHKFDILHVANHIGFASNFLSLAKSKFLNSQKIVCTYHGPEDPRKIPTCFEAITQPSPYYIENARKINVDTAKWFCLPNFVDTRRFNSNVKTRIRQEYSIPDDAFLILSVGAISMRYKRMHHVLEETARLAKSADVYLLIVGQEEDDTQHVKFLGRKLLDSRVRFASSIPDEKMPQIYASADIFVLASLNEFFGLAFLEAMASGKPVIGHNWPTTKWVIGDGGETIDMTAKNNLARTLKKYLSDPTFGKEKGRLARERVENLFSMEKVVNDVIHLYNKILE